MNVFIAEEIRSKNKGEAAICFGIIEGLKRVTDNLNIFLCSSEPDIDSLEYGNEMNLLYDNFVSTGNFLHKVLGHIYLSMRFLLFIILYIMFKKNALFIMRAKLWKLILETDVFLIGHDNTLVNNGPYTLFYIPLIAKLLKKPTAIYAGSIGPFSSKLSKLLTKWIVGNVNLVTLREKVSLETFNKYGFKNNNVHLTADPAFIMPAADEKRVYDILINEKICFKENFICTTISQELGNDYGKSKCIAKPLDEYAEMRAKLLDHFSLTYNLEIMILSHSLGPEPFRDDRVMSHLVYDKMKQKENCHIIKSDYNAKDLKGLIGKCQFLIADRTHSMIAATSLGIPILCITSKKRRQKNVGIIGEMLNLQTSIIDVENLEYDDFLQKAVTIWNKRLQIRNEMAKLIPTVLKKSEYTAILVNNLVNNWK